MPTLRDAGPEICLADQPKYRTAPQLAALAVEMARRGQRLVFTNGVFDLLHVNHVRHLQAARCEGDALLVAVNGDASVRGLKGEGRPVWPEAHRVEMLAALACVDYVTVFPELRVARLLREVRPHVYVKGKDYRPESIDPEERAALEEIGVEIRFLPSLPGPSTTSILRELARGGAAGPGS